MARPRKKPVIIAGSHAQAIAGSVECHAGNNNQIDRLPGGQRCRIGRRHLQAVFANDKILRSLDGGGRHFAILRTEQRRVNLFAPMQGVLDQSCRRRFIGRGDIEHHRPALLINRPARKQFRDSAVPDFALRRGGGAANPQKFTPQLLFVFRRHQSFH